MPGYIRTPDGRLVAIPTPVTPLEEETEEEEGDDLSDLFEVPKTGDLSDLMDASGETEVSEEDVIGGDADMSEDLLESDAEMTEEDEEDLFGVSEADVMGYKPKPRKPKIMRTTKYYPPPLTTLGGMRQ